MSGPKTEVREYVEAFVIAIVLAGFIITFVAQTFLVQGQSMEPTLLDGQRVLADKITYRLRPPARGEIIVFQYPSDPRRKFIKRVIGIPGDEVEVRGYRVYLNGSLLHEEYIRGPMQGNFGPFRVPPGHVFVMGDNRPNSDDSRYRDVGPVPRSLIVGRALLVYWPPGQASWIRVPQIFAGDR